MAENFLIKTSIAQGDLIRMDGTVVLERYETLRALVTARLGPEMAGMFAVPLIGRDRDGPSLGVSWYSDHAGTARPLASLDGAIRQDVAARLADAVQAIRAMDATDDERALLDAALSVRDPGDVLVVGARPVLVNWGVAPDTAPLQGDGRRSNFDATLGALLPAAAAGAITAPGRAGAGAQDDAPPPSGTGMQAATTTPPPAAPPPSPPRGRGGWWVPLVLSAILALLTLWLLMPGVRVFPPRPPALAQDMSDNALDVARRINADLEARADALQDALDGAVCTAEGDFLLPDGRTPEGLLPPGPADPEGASDPEGQQDAALREGQAAPMLPPNPARIRPGPAPGGGEAASLLDLIEARTVLILASAGEGMGIGTGFFIAPDVVATNHHVVADSLLGGEVLVVNGQWTRPRPAQVIQYDGPFETTGEDFALLRVAQSGADQPYYSLLDAQVPVKGQAVTAAGFPFDITGDDLRFRRLMEGGDTPPPDLVVTNGIVNSQQMIADTVSVLVHSASISKGNSGGPLVDQCGRVVGVNTFISEQSYRTLNVAQSMGNLRRFLDEGGVHPAFDDQPCIPSISPARPADEGAAAPPADAPQAAAP